MSTSSFGNSSINSGHGVTFVLCLCALTHAYLLFSAFPYTGYFALILLKNNTNNQNETNKLTLDTIGIYVGLLSSAFALGRMLGLVPWKKVRSTYGGKPSMIASLLLSAVFSITFGMSQSFGGAMLSRFGLGLSNGMGGIMKRAAINLVRNGKMNANANGGDEKDGMKYQNHQGEEEEWIMSRLLAVMSFGVALGPAMSGWLSSDIDTEEVGEATASTSISYPYLMPNIFQAALCLISALFVALIVNQSGGPMFSIDDDTIVESKESNNGSKNGESKPLLQEVKENDSNNNLTKVQDSKQAKPLSNAFSIIWKSKTTRSHLEAYTAFSFCVAAIDEALPLFLIARLGGPGLTVSQVGLVLGLSDLIPALLQRVVTIGNVLTEGLGGIYPMLRLSGFMANVPMVLVPVSLVLLGSDSDDEATASSSGFQEVTGMSTMSFSYLVILVGGLHYFSFVYFGMIGVATGRTVPMSYTDDASRIMTWFAFAARTAAPTVAGGILTLLPGSPWKVWTILGLGMGMFAAVLSYMLHDAASAGWEGRISDLVKRRSVYLSNKQRALAYTRLWEVHYDHSSETIGAKWRRLVRKVIAVNRMTGGALSASDEETGADIIIGTTSQVEMKHQKRVSWSHRMLMPGIDIDEVPFFILGTHKGDIHCHPHVMTPPLMESLRAHLPGAACDCNFWLKYSLLRDGASLEALEAKVGYARYTLMAIETLSGNVFGCFMAIPWKRQGSYRMSGQSFLWKMKKTRSLDDSVSANEQASIEEDIQTYKWTGENELCQLFTSDKIAVGGGVLDGAKGDGFGFLIDSDLERGSTSPCKTYGNPSLVSDNDSDEFEIANIEVWSLTPFLSEADAERNEQSQRFREQNSVGQSPSSQSPWSQFL